MKLNSLSIRTSRRAMNAGLFGALLALSSGLGVDMAKTDDYPAKAVTIVVPFAPGGGADITSRLMADRLSAKLGQTFVVENRPGASGNIGYRYVSRTDADGYTLLWGYSTTSTCNHILFKDAGWKQSDFDAVASYVRFPLAITVHNSVPVNDIQELIGYLKENPGRVSYGALGAGTQVHLATELFKQMTGTDMVGAHYKSSGEAVPDLLAGNIQLVFDALAPYRQHVQAGTLKTLVVADSKRDPALPDVPTTGEVGLEGLIQTGYWPLLVPAGTDPAIIAKLANAMKEASEDEEFREKVLSLKFNNEYQGPEQLKLALAEESATCANVIRDAKITIE